MFTTLFAGLCAVMVEHSRLPAVAVGEIVGGECAFRLILGDSGDEETPPLEIRAGEPHRFMVQIKPDVAFLFVDDMLFDLRRGERL
jgi:hypothetical protein